MISADVIKKIRRIHITTSRLVTDAFAGRYQSVFKGKGMEFEEVREYQPGDDVRSIDWNVTARMGHPYVKKFVEERELTVMFLLDLSPSCHFGTVHQFKTQLATEVCSLLSFSAIKNNDRIGLILFTDRVEKFIPPRKGVSHVLRVIREVICFKPEGRGTDIPGALEFLNRISTRRTVVFILSDFYAPHLKTSLSIANRRHDLVAITLMDPVEFNLPDIGLVKLEDAESGKPYLIDTSDSQLRKEYHHRSVKKFEERNRLFNSTQVDHIDLRTDVPYLPILTKFFRMREQRYTR
jgi:uncharacterized protein (DUF58 family)